ncbi:MAG: hypothetical protein PHD74_00380 [Candidatus Krumholzibacteria bacterium]|nr:hypothetical protein [Candidatus Krumholzibacteria bacterium]
MAKRSVTRAPFTFGGDPEAFCAECQLPCNLEEMSIDCHRRFFLHGMTNCSYFVYGYCFLVDQPGCVFDNGARHDEYWLHLLNEYLHNASRREEDDEFRKRREEVLKLVASQIENHTVYLCRYLEEYYNQIMGTGGGLSEDMMSRLDEAYLSLLRGITRKPD